MTYVSGFVIPVPTDRKDDYRKMAEDASVMFRDHGALEMMEVWGEDVRDGATADAAERRMETDDRMHPPEDAPCDMTRMIYGGFVPIFQMGREGADR